MRQVIKNGFLNFAVKENSFFSKLKEELGYDVLTQSCQRVFDENSAEGQAELEFIAESYSVFATLPLGDKVIADLFELSSRQEFVFDLLTKLLPRFSNAPTILMHGFDSLIDALKARHSKTIKDDFALVNDLLRIYSSLQRVKRASPEPRQIDPYIKNITSMIEFCFNSDLLTDPRNIEYIFCSDSFREDLTVHFRTDVIRKSAAFFKGHLANALDDKMLQLFSHYKIVSFINDVFWGYSISKSTIDGFVFMKGYKGFMTKLKNISSDHLNCSYPKNARQLWNLESDLIRARRCPAIMYISEGLSTFFLLFMICWVLLKVYVNDDLDPTYKGSEILLVILSFSKLLFEYGESVGNVPLMLPTWDSMEQYLSKAQNWNDCAGLTLLMSWLILRFHGLDQVFYYKACLATSAIFFSISVLQHMMINESVGKLILVLMEMTKNLATFAVVFAFVIFGFSVCLYSIMNDNREGSFEGYEDAVETFLTVFTAALGTFSNSSMSIDSPYRILCVVISVSYLIIANVVLMSLIIAQMSATHDEIKANALTEYNYNRGLIVRDYLLIEERNVFAMLPPPLNLIPALFWPFHYKHFLKCASHTLTDSDFVMRKKKRVEANRWNQRLWFKGINMFSFLLMSDY